MNRHHHHHHRQHQFVQIRKRSLDSTNACVCVRERGGERERERERWGEKQKVARMSGHSCFNEQMTSPPLFVSHVHRVSFSPSCLHIYPVHPLSSLQHHLQLSSIMTLLFTFTFIHPVITRLTSASLFHSRHLSLSVSLSLICSQSFKTRRPETTHYHSRA